MQKKKDMESWLLAQWIPASHIRTCGFEFQLCFGPLLMSSLPGTKRWLQYLSPCCPHGTSALDCKLSSSARLIFSCWEQLEDGKKREISPPHCVCMCLCVFHINKNTKIHELERSSKTLWKCILQNHYA